MLDGATCCCVPAAACRGSAVPLIEAVKAGDVDRGRERCLQQRVDVNAPEPDGTTALHWAAHRDDLAAGRPAAQGGCPRGARPTVTASRRLSLAAANGNGAVVERLLKAGADANPPSTGGETVADDGGARRPDATPSRARWRTART